MDVKVTVEAPHSRARVFAWVEDLAHYPLWLDFVRRADAEPEGAAWAVDLRARIGPLARSKRLRMIRTGHEPDRHVRFERAELDGRHHSTWVLDADVEASGTGSELVLSLHYGGSLLAPALQRILSDEIERSRQRFLSCLDAPPP
jgi:Polyketide cyclase / dehydrase and lipid transport